MGTRARHVWKSYRGLHHATGRRMFLTQCSRVVESQGDSEKSVATLYSNLDTATCMDCLRSIQRIRLHSLERDSAIVNTVTKRIESLRRGRT